MRQEERARILHEGSGQQTKEGYIEIIFDNSDNRMPIDKTVVSIKRTFNLKEDK